MAWTSDCRDCGKEKVGKSIRAFYCHECARARRKAWREKNRDHLLDYHRRYREADPDAAVARTRKWRYGVTDQRYREMLEEQGGVCKICKAPPLEKRLSVDHHHDSGAIRGLLCSNCNTGVGMFRDDRAILEAAIRYLAAAEGETA